MLSSQRKKSSLTIELVLVLVTDSLTLKFLKNHNESDFVESNIYQTERHEWM